LHVQLSGIVAGKEEHCLVTVIDITGRRLQEEENNKVQFELSERLKELNCHNRISEVMSISNLSIDEVCEQVIHLIPDGWQFPEITEARIQIGEKSYCSTKYKTSRNLLHQEIKISDEVIGSLEVCLPDDKFPVYGPLFFPEESSLLFSIAEHLGTFIEKKRVNNNLLESEIKYRNIFENLRDVYYETTVDGLITEISPSVEIISKGQYMPGMLSLKQCRNREA
jgi:PAS domain-containing protein